jgi:maltodextrin utilization protein YvdJ
MGQRRVVKFLQLRLLRLFFHVAIMRPLALNASRKADAAPSFLVLM